MIGYEKRDGKTLFIFIDESGDFVFSDKGTNYFILTAITTTNPLNKRDLVIGTRYELLQDGEDLEYFHATEDPQHTRDRFYSKIKLIPDYEIDSIIAEKRKANIALYEELELSEKSEGKGFRVTINKVEEKFYKQICETLLKYIIYRYKNIKKDILISKIVVVLDQALPNRKREFVIRSIKTYFKDNFGIVPHMFFHSTKSDINSQIADYCCWAIKQKWDDKEMRPYEEIKGYIKNEFDVFRKGEKKFY